MTQGHSFAVYIVVNTSIKLKYQNFFIVLLQVILLLLINNLGKFHDFWELQRFKFDQNVIILRISLIFSFWTTLFELDFIQNFYIDPFAEFIKLGEISLLNQLINSIGLLLGLEITGLNLIVRVIFIDHKCVVRVESLWAIKEINLQLG